MDNEDFDNQQDNAGFDNYNNQQNKVSLDKNDNQQENAGFNNYNAYQNDDGYIQASTPQNIQQNLNQQYSQSTEKASGYAIAGMVLGIVSIVCCCAWHVSLICGVLGLIFSIITKVKDLPGGGLATAGIICSAIGIILAVFMIFVLVIIRVTYGSAVNSLSPQDWQAIYDSLS